MALVVQTDDGNTTNANSYIDVAFFKSYHDDRAHDYSGYSDTKIAAACVVATDYVDTRFQFRGIQLVGGQSTQWPRQTGLESLQPWFDVNFIDPLVDTDSGNFIALVGPDGQDIIGVPTAIKKATAEYALRALANPLFQDAPAPSVGPMPGRLVDEYSVTVDVITENIKYAPPQSGAFVMPAYPPADLLLVRAGLISAGRTLMR